MKHHSVHAKSKPQAPAVIMAQSGKVISWEEYDRRVNPLARHFRHIGLAEKDHIAILMEKKEHRLKCLNRRMLLLFIECV